MFGDLLIQSLCYIISIMACLSSLVVIALLAVSMAAPAGDKMKHVPGYPETYNTSVFTGYLDLKSTERAAHYVFVESVKGASNNDPVTLWLNGGPGCSSLIGFIQQIGPYYIEEGVNYHEGDNLTENKYSWHQVSNLLFLESPAGVGYSYNTNQTFHNNDATTAHDNMNALLDFFQKYPEYRNNPFWIAGESYAGKYIPDLAVLIDRYNLDSTSQINLKGVLIGNGVMSFGQLPYSEVKYMMDRSFVNPEIKDYWNHGCVFDPDSAGCRFFSIQFQEDVDEINPYNVYSYCYYNDSFDRPQKRYASQQSILLNIKNKLSNGTFKDIKYNAAPCSYFDGMFNYFNLHEYQYRAKFPNQKWNGPCAQNITYQIDPQGSMAAYRYLLGRLHQKNYQIHLYNGNWDVVVPYHDTVDNINRLNLQQSYIYIPWFTNDQHSGFSQVYSGIIFTIVKGASHMVPQTKRPEALNIFNSTIEGSKDLYKYPQKASAKQSQSK